MNMPGRRQAFQYLQDANQLNPGPWFEHSVQVAQASEMIARNHPKLNPEVAYIVGLLHDIGRREGVFGMRHVWDGYQFLFSEGYPTVARICLTHSYPIPDVEFGATHWDGTPDQKAFVQSFLNSNPYSPYDRLIQLTDSICLPSGPVLMEKRLVDVALRYGINQNTTEKWRALFEIQNDFEKSIGESIYNLLPEVMGNTFKERVEIL